MKFDWKEVGKCFGVQIGIALVALGYIFIGVRFGVWIFIVGGLASIICTSLMYGKK